jgi:N-acetylglucosamine kinase-like BadF-type ATPase
LAVKDSPRTKYFIGIDSGATSSEVLIVQIPLAKALPLLVKGKFKGVEKKPVIKKYPPINFNVLGFDESAKRLIHIIQDSSKKIGLKNIGYIVAGISGARNEKDRKKLSHAVSKNLGFNKIKILPDTEIAFYSVFEQHQTSCGILIAGTGSVLLVKGVANTMRRVGGWGRILGDEGSGYWIAREALSFAVKCYDKSSKKNEILHMLEKKFKLDEGNIIEQVYHKNFDISKITKEVFRLAEGGNVLADSIIRRAVQHLAELLTCITKAEHVIALCGSLFTEEKLLEKYLRNIVKEEFPYITLIKPNRKPVWGAVEIARSHCEL